MAKHFCQRGSRCFSRFWRICVAVYSGWLLILLTGNNAWAVASVPCDGVLSTQGNTILDEDGEFCRIAGINWFGFESKNRVLNGLWARGWKEMMNEIRDKGFNTLRIPFAGNSFFRSNGAEIPYQKINGIDYTIGSNPELLGLSPLQILDKIVGYAPYAGSSNNPARKGLRIILVHHRSTVGIGANPNGLWYGPNPAYSETYWQWVWLVLAERYRNSAVIGADLHNEPHGQPGWDYNQDGIADSWACWPDGVNVICPTDPNNGYKPTDWRTAAEQLGQQILAVNSAWLIIVEGVQHLGYEYPRLPWGNAYWWGGNLYNARYKPVVLNANKLVYSAHDYPNSVMRNDLHPELACQPWLGGPNYHNYPCAPADDFPNNLKKPGGVWDTLWGYLHKGLGVAPVPVLLGEFGTLYSRNRQGTDLQEDRAWLTALVNYLGKTGDANSANIHWTYWAWDPLSRDTGGILGGCDNMENGTDNAGWFEEHYDKENHLRPIMFPRREPTALRCP